MGATKDLPVSTCPHCQYEMDACTSVDGDAVPKEGDISVCLNCGSFLEFNHELGLDLYPDSNLLDLPDEMRLQLTRARMLITERGPVSSQ